MGWWAFEVFTQLAAFLPKVDLAGQTILRNIGLYTFMIPVGISMGANTLVGNRMVKAQPQIALKAYRLCYGLTLAWSIAQIVLIWFGFNPIINFYTSSKVIKQHIEPAWAVLCAFVFFDCMQIVSSSTISGLNLVGKIKFVTIVTYWFFGIPTAWYLMFKQDLKLRGLWYGPTIACLLNFVYYEVIIHRTDWVERSQEICAQIKEDDRKLKEQKAGDDDFKEAVSEEKMEESRDEMMMM